MPQGLQKYFVLGQKRYKIVQPNKFRLRAGAPLEKRTIKPHKGRIVKENKERDKVGPEHQIGDAPLPQPLRQCALVRRCGANPGSWWPPCSIHLLYRHHGILTITYTACWGTRHYALPTGSHSRISNKCSSA